MLTKISCAVAALLASTFFWSGMASAQTFVWNRTGTQFVDSNSRVEIAAQDVSQPDEGIDTNPTDDHTSSQAAVNLISSVPGGSGSGGGEGAWFGWWGADGGDGDPEGGQDGEDGLPGDGTVGGQGGTAGAAGEVSASATAVGIAELNPDNQSVLSWSFIHNHIAYVSLSAGGGGGGDGVRS